MEDKKLGRREFLGRSAMLGAAGIVGTSLLSSCGGNGRKPLRKPGEYYLPSVEDKAISGRKLRVGMVGCGGRGTGALGNLLDAADDIELVALGDILPGQLRNCREKIARDYGQTIPDEMCFLGFESYRQVIDSGIDMVILTTPPVFRPEQFQYAVEKGVHAFLEKPVCIDPVGYRKVIAASRQARLKGLCVLTGTERRHERPYVAAYEKIQQGYIGEIISGEVYWQQGKPWYATREPGMTDMEYMIRDWFNWRWLAGDHIVEQHVHNIDVFLWMTGDLPRAATGFGSRVRRRSGDQFDQFSVDFEFAGGKRLHSMCRQIDGCSNRVGEVIHGTRGRWMSKNNSIVDLQGNTVWQYDEAEDKKKYRQHDSYVLEHVDWVNHIRKGGAFVEAEDNANSCMAAIMGREAAYTGERTYWEKMIVSDQNFRPEKVGFFDVDLSRFKVPVPGE